LKVDSIAILDCGAQYTKVIDRRIRELSVRSEVFPLDVPAGKLEGYDGIILSGGPLSVWEGALEYDKELFNLGVPILGICYGMQLINKHFGGIVSPGVKSEYGETDIDVDPTCLLFDDLDKNQRVLMSHGDSVEVLADGFEVCGTTGHVCAAMHNRQRQLYGVQFHPEVDLTVNGVAMLRNFLYKICGLTGNYVLEDRIDTAITKIKNQVGRGKVLVLVSGGVDSAVSAALLLRALDPESIHAIHVDHGLMRKNESDIICEQLKHLGLKNLIREDAGGKFFDSVVAVNGKSIGPLTRLVDPEEKRNLIGEVFVRVIQEVSRRLNLVPEETFWAQGTLRPDLIESGNPDVSTTAHKIKTHHNDVEMIRLARAEGKVVETNWDWHKDEVRQVARKLGITEKIASRQPFPGPGLAIRAICYDGKGSVDRNVRERFDAVMARIGNGYGGEVLPIRTVGVQGDHRSYRHLSLIWSEGPELDWKRVYKIGNSLPNEVDGINRVAYVLNRENISSTINCYEMYINDETIGLLRELDHIITARLDKPPVSQVLAVLLPVGFTKRYSVAVRTFITNDYMTGRPAFIGQDVDSEDITRLVDEIERDFSEIDLILYDVTSKPPATVEWQ
jgi:GMP synthase (glutamine-hydrolysing)